MANRAYLTLASCYDRLNDGVNYEEWADSVQRRLAAYCPHPTHRILDLACGTGNMLMALLRRGYSVCGVDLSSDMLSEAQRKASEEGYLPLLLCQDMRTFQIYAGKRAQSSALCDCVTCCLDSINYLTASGDLAQCFSRVRAHLHEGGLFMFDVNTPYKFAHTYAQNDYVIEAEGVVCTWQNDYNPRTKICRFDLSLFREEADGRYVRSDEVHRERCYALRTIEKELQRASFEICEVSSDLIGSPVTDRSERAYFCARAI